MAAIVDSWLKRNYVEKPWFHLWWDLTGYWDSDSKRKEAKKQNCVFVLLLVSLIGTELLSGHWATSKLTAALRLGVSSQVLWSNSEHPQVGRFYIGKRSYFVSSQCGCDLILLFPIPNNINECRYMLCKIPQPHECSIQLSTLAANTIARLQPVKTICWNMHWWFDTVWWHNQL